MPNYISILKEKGLKVTEQRITVFRRLAENKNPLLLNELQGSLGTTVNRITLYRVLNDLEDNGLIRIFFGLDGQKYIEAKRSTENTDKEKILKHLHFQCEKCDEIFCFDDVLILGLPQGFKIKTDKTVLAGFCQKCS